jgi:uncharacterized membrane protein
VFATIILAPILLPVIAAVVLVVKLKHRLGIPSNQVAPRLMKFFFGWGGLAMLAWTVFVIGSTAITDSPQGPLMLFFLPWIFSVGAAIGVGHWYWKHYAT